jgi:fatty-acyl-CoA synthase
MFSAEVKQGLIDHLPDLAIADVLGATEGASARPSRRRASRTEAATFSLNATTKIFTEDGREVEPGSVRSGSWRMAASCRSGTTRIEKSAYLPRGQRPPLLVPGDMATIAADGTLVLFGRGSNCINTGGEKVYPEEVEEALKVHRPSRTRRLRRARRPVRSTCCGHRLADPAKAQLQTRSSPMPAIASPATSSRRNCASYEVPRAPNGKANYPVARELFSVQSGQT